MDAVDLRNCDREPIHIPGCIQPHGVLLALDPATLTILQLAGDTARYFGLQPSQLLGQGMGALVGPDAIGRLRAIAVQQFNIPRSAFTFETGIEHGGQAFDAVVHLSDGLLVVELQPRLSAAPVNALDLVQSMITRVQRAPNVSSFLQAATEEVRAVTGFDRVMVYRFAPDESGAVISEAKDEALEPYLRHHYPASDIPKQARELYLRNRMRLIPDAHYKPAPITPELNPLTGRPLDLTFSVLRSVSPIHLEYLANMGVAASMSLSLVIEGKLWGLIACHHRKPRQIPLAVRGVCELFAQMISLQLGEKLANCAQREGLRTRQTHARLVESMIGQDRLDEALTGCQPSLTDYIPAGGVAVWWEGKATRLGRTPSPEQIELLVDWLNASVPEGVFATDNLAARFPPAGAYAGAASGLLALSVSRTPRDYVLWFRPEVSRTVTWAGNPSKPVSVGDDGIRIGPRKSFAAWKEIVRGHSEPWGESIVQAAQELRLSILEVVLRHQDKVMREREKVRRHQDLLMAELDHRVKNTIATIQALVKYSSTGATGIDTFTQSVQDRLYAMARTHGLLTQARWEGINLQQIIAGQFEPYGGPDRVVATGPALMLKPKTALSFSLALHELITNAAKYGALSVPEGRVEIAWKEQIREGERWLALRWAEHGGPAVAPPTRVGFGRVLLEQTLAYDVDGEVDLDFRPEGLVCTAAIPFEHIIKAEH